ncbi:hypothetical protein K438DRAFT_796724 [Mycena galopus ATCC 62051]|nr:hypothetical protein K438DRAFT_796724 [Mycena galopus ATCC 62051]
MRMHRHRHQHRPAHRRPQIQHIDVRFCVAVAVCAGTVRPHRERPSIPTAPCSLRLYMRVRTHSPANRVVVLAFTLARFPPEKPAPAFIPKSAPTPIRTGIHIPEPAPPLALALRRPALAPAALKRAHHPLHAPVPEAARWARTRAWARPSPPVVSVGRVFISRGERRLFVLWRERRRARGGVGEGRRNGDRHGAPAMGRCPVVLGVLGVEVCIPVRVFDLPRLFVHSRHPGACWGGGAAAAEGRVAGTLVVGNGRRRGEGRGRGGCEDFLTEGTRGGAEGGGCAGRKKEERALVIVWGTQETNKETMKRTKEK